MQRRVDEPTTLTQTSEPYKAVDVCSFVSSVQVGMLEPKQRKPRQSSASEGEQQLRHWLEQSLPPASTCCSASCSKFPGDLLHRLPKSSLWMRVSAPCHPTGVTVSLNEANSSREGLKV